MAHKLPQEIFLQTFTHVPRIACNLIIKNLRGELLLTKRRKPPCIGMWHYPGSFLLKDETIDTCLQRVAREELGITLSGDGKLLGVYENLKGDPRGHIIDILYEYKLSDTEQLSAVGDTEDIQFFFSLPEKIGFGHDLILRKIGCV